MLRRVLMLVMIISLFITIVPLFSGVSYAASKPGKPVITSVKSSKNAITVKYKKVKKAKKYQIAYKKASSSKWRKVTTKKQKYSIKKLACATKYSVKVRAYNGKWGKWSKTRTVSTASRIMITKLTSLTRAPRNAKELTDNYGARYSYAIQPADSYAKEYEYLINKKYGRFSGTIYVPKGDSNDYVTGIIIKGDGRVLYTSPAMKKTSRPIKFSINITGVNRLTVEWSSAGYNVPDICIASPYLYYVSARDKAINIKSFPIAMTDLTSVDRNPYLVSPREWIDNFGNMYNSAVIGSSQYDLGYLFDGKYKRFTGTLYIPKGRSFKGNVRMTVISDGNTIYTSPLMSITSAPVRFSIDVTGRNYTQIVLSRDNSNGRLYLAYPYLYQ